MVVFVVATLLSVFLVSLIAFIGLFFLGFKAEKLKTVLIYLVSFSAGVLFGDAFLHLLPEAAEGGFSIIVSAGVLSGIGCFFVLEKVIHWQHCHLPITKQHVHQFAYTNVVGDGLYNLIDGMIIAASYMASVPVGVATTLAVLLHEIPQEIGDFGVLLHGGFSKGKALFVNFLSALTAFIGAGIVLVFGNGLGVFLVPFAAGSFIYIAGSDLIPELHKETRLPRSLLQVGLFALGIGVMVALLFLE